MKKLNEEMKSHNDEKKKRMVYENQDQNIP
jgi:hypothetical protein